MRALSLPRAATQYLLRLDPNMHGRETRGWRLRIDTRSKIWTRGGDLRERWWLAPIHSQCLPLPVFSGALSPERSPRLVSKNQRQASYRKRHQQDRLTLKHSPKSPGTWLLRPQEARILTPKQASMRALLLASRALIKEGEQESLLRF